jgi:hypothetical protein
MDTETGRNWITTASLALTAAHFMFFIIAPVVGYPLTFVQAMRLLEIVLPVFLGYLGSAAYFLFSAGHASSPSARVSSQLLGLLVRGPVIVFGLASLSVIVAFGVSNSRYASRGSGMSIDMFAAAITGALGLLTVTTNVVVSYLFSAEGNIQKQNE